MGKPDHSMEICQERTLMQDGCQNMSQGHFIGQTRGPGGTQSFTPATK